METTPRRAETESLRDARTRLRAEWKRLEVAAATAELAADKARDAYFAACDALSAALYGEVA
jgi:hypothetical protein